MAMGAKNAALSDFPSLDRLITLLNNRSARSAGLIEEMSGGVVAAGVPGVAGADSGAAFPDPSRKKVITINAPIAARGTAHRKTGDIVGAGAGGAAGAALPPTDAPQLWQNSASGRNFVPHWLQKRAFEPDGLLLID
jgi:hypothetical protein